MIQISQLKLQIPHTEEQLEEKIKGIIGSKVAIRRRNNEKGKIEIEYYSQDELERIVELLESVR